MKLTTTPLLSSQNDAGRQIKIIRDHQKRNALLEQNLSTPLCSSSSQIHPALTWTRILPYELLDEARQKYDRLRNAPSEEERREQLRGELKRHVKEKIKQDLKYAVSTLSSNSISPS